MMKKILISDVKESEVISYVNALTKNEYIVKGTPFGSQIIPLFETLKPDIVILGSCVGSDNDIEIVKELKGINKDVKIIIMGHFKSLEEELNLAGANDFLVKPVSVEKLIETIEK